MSNIVIFNKVHITVAGIFQVITVRTTAFSAIDAFIVVFVPVQDAYPLYECVTYSRYLRTFNLSMVLATQSLIWVHIVYCHTNEGGCHDNRRFRGVFFHFRVYWYIKRNVLFDILLNMKESSHFKCYRRSNNVFTFTRKWPVDLAKFAGWTEFVFANWRLSSNCNLDGVFCYIQCMYRVVQDFKRDCKLEVR